MADVLPEELMQTVLGKLYAVLTGGDESVAPASQDNFFSWCSPGIPITEDSLRFLSTGLSGVFNENSLAKGEDGKPIPLTDAEKDKLRASDTGQLYMQAENLARIVDFIPDINTGVNGGLSRLSIMENEGTLSDVYKYALQFSQVANTELSEGEKAQLERFKQLLQVKKTKKDVMTGEEIEYPDSSPLVEVYNQKMTVYIDAVLEYNTHRVAALAANNAEAVHFWALNAGALRKKVQAAMSDWVSNGHKNDYEQIVARIDQIQSKDLSLLKAEYKDTLDKTKLTGIASGADFYYTSLVPGDFTKGGWTKFTFKSSDYEQHKSTKSTSYGVKASGGFFGIGAKGGFEHSDSHVKRTIDASNFTLEFEICQVPIVRPWFKTVFLTSKAWKLDPTTNPEIKSRGEVLSDGEMPPKGILPGYPTTVVFIRNLILNFGSHNSDFQTDFTSNSANGSVGWGPLNVGTHYSSSKGEESFESHSNFQGIRVDGMQIIGFKCHLLPKSPDPLPSITSWI